MNKPHIVLITMDLDAGTTTIVRSDSMEARFETGFKGEHESQVARIQYSPPLRGVLMTTTSGDQVSLPLVTPSDPGMTGERPIVYLDQNQWSALARIEDGQSLAKPEEDSAARQLIAWAEAHRVVLPISSGHCVETTEWTNNNRRYRLGLTLMRLSSAWQMRHPLDVERDEILTSLVRFTGELHVPPPVFSGVPSTLTAEAERRGYEPSDDLPWEYRELLESLLDLSVTFDLVTDGTPIERQRSSIWRKAQQAFSDSLDRGGGTSTEKRNRVLAFFINDISHTVAQAAATTGVPSNTFSTWLQERFVTDLPTMPFLGLRREFLTGKHLDRSARWHDNDLIDKMFLCLAGGYADLVICESSAASHLRQAQKRLGRPETAVSKFAAGVELLNTNGAETILLDNP